MAVGINDVHQLCYNLAAKQQTAFPSPQNFNDYANLANMDLYNYYNDERDKMILKVKAGSNLYISPILANFVKYDVILTQAGNQLTLPADYGYDLALTTTDINGVKTNAKKVDYDHVANYLNSTIDAPTVTNPIYVELPDTFIVYPASAGNFTETYLKLPVTVNWGYTIVNQRPVYNPATSVDFEFNKTEIFRLATRVLFYMGISIKDSELAREASQMVMTAS